jgi:Immunity protein 27
MPNYLEPFETELLAGAELVNGDLVPDEAARRIYQLTHYHLRHLGDTDGGWATLYRDPDDGRLWEKIYPHGNLQGGGLARLHVLSEAGAERRYGHDVLLRGGV